jgi:transcriptional regulator with XRE-family HTH domain
MTRSFGARLRSARERKGIGLDAIAQSTKINAGLFEALEHDDASRWPSGIFRRAFMRAYANAVGLDPEATVTEFLAVFPDPFDARPTSALEPGGSGAARPEFAVEPAALRLTLAEEPWRSPRAGVDALLGRSLRACAAACDLAVVIGIAAAVFAAAGRFWTPFTIATVCYYFGGVLVIGNSPGAWLLAAGRTKRAPQQRIAPPTLPTLSTVPAAASTADETDSLQRFPTRRYPKAV